MTTFGVAMVKDEADIIGYVLDHMLTQVDGIIIADNMSTDDTVREIVRRSGKVRVRIDPETGYYQSRKMSALAEQAAEMGADWVVPFDADEIWYSPFGRIADVLADLPPDIAIASAALYDHVATALDPNEDNPIRRLGWRRTYAAPLTKVAVRPTLPVTIEQGNHGAHYSTGQIDGQLIVRHFPYRSAEQMIRKARNGAAAYAATDLPEHEGGHWRGYGSIIDSRGEEALAEVFRQWFWHAEPEMVETLIYDPAPCVFP